MNNIEKIVEIIGLHDIDIEQGNDFDLTQIAKQIDALYSQPQKVVCPKPKIVCFCGSSRFIDHFAVLQWEWEKEGWISLGLHLLPQGYKTNVPDHLAEAEGVNKKMDELHRRKIDMADLVFIINVGGYIGESTKGELEYARQNGKTIRFLEPT
jgi:hypothetical protein